MERRRLAGSPKRKIYKRDNTAINQFVRERCAAKCTLCGYQHERGAGGTPALHIPSDDQQQGGKWAPVSMAFSCLRWRRESGKGGIAGSPSSVRLYVVTSLPCRLRRREYGAPVSRRLPLVRASLCGPFPPQRLRWHRVSLSSHQNPKKIFKK